MKDKIIIKTVLHDFIDSKVNEYVEPCRQGTPKGDPIGFSRKKYIATLGMLTNQKLIDMAKSIGVSYGLLRKWTTEQEFKDMVAKHYDEFTTWIIIFFVSRINASQKHFELLEKKPISELADIQILGSWKKEQFDNDIALEKLADAKNYNPRLLHFLLEFLEDYMNNELPKIDANTAYLFKLNFINFLDIIKGSETKVITDALEKMCWNDLHNAIARNLSKPKMSEKDRRESLIMIKALMQLER